MSIQQWSMWKTPIIHSILYFNIATLYLYILIYKLLTGFWIPSWGTTSVKPLGNKTFDFNWERLELYRYPGCVRGKLKCAKRGSRFSYKIIAFITVHKKTYSKKQACEHSHHRNHSHFTWPSSQNLCHLWDRRQVSISGHHFRPSFGLSFEAAVRLKRAWLP